jgi:NitT/TauT family transport system substrate-binding protein
LSAVAATLTLGACALDQHSAASGAVEVVIGYQSKTINTVTAGTLLRAQGWLEQRPAARTAHGGSKYHVTWED